MNLMQNKKLRINNVYALKREYMIRDYSLIGKQSIEIKFRFTNRKCFFLLIVFQLSSKKVKYITFFQKKIFCCDDGVHVRAVKSIR